MDGLYLGTGAYDPITKEVQLYWGECLEKCHPKQGGVMTAPSFFLTVSTNGFSTWTHVNQTALAESDPARLGIANCNTNANCFRIFY